MKKEIKLSTPTKINWETQGQTGAKNLLSSFLQAFVKTRKIPHAFLFAGPSGVGKLDLATEFAQKIFTLSTTRPEVYQYDLLENPSIDSARQLIALSALTSGEWSKKVFILNNFHTASQAVTNALLKTLEEPASSSVFILLSDVSKLLPTVMSRCVLVRCFPEPTTQNLNLPPNLALAVAGLPRLAQRFLNDSELAQQFENHLALIDNTNNQSRILSATKLAELNKETLTELFLLWNRLKANQLANSTNLAQVLREIIGGQNILIDLRKNNSVKLALQQFFMETI